MSTNKKDQERKREKEKRPIIQKEVHEYDPTELHDNLIFVLQSVNYCSSTPHEMHCIASDGPDTGREL